MFSYITPVLKSLHWIKVKKRIEYKLLSHLEVLTTLSIAIFLNWSLFSLIALLDPPLLSPPTSSSLKITNRSFQHAAPHLWNKLPHSLREPHPRLGLLPSHLFPFFTINHSFSFSLRLKTHVLFLKSFPPWTSP